MVEDSEEPPRKRARSEDTGGIGDALTPVTGSSKQPYPRGSIWLDDGNILVVSEQGTAFRVLRSILSRDSDVFRDMFMIPQPEDAEKLDGSPVVHLSDTTRDLEHMLSALFDHGCRYVLMMFKLLL